MSDRTETPTTWRKKPVEIQAIRYLPPRNCAAVAAFLDDEPAECEGHDDFPDHHEQPWLIETLEGTMTASPGDYIIRGVQNEFYPCKPDIFEATYELVEDTPAMSDRYRRLGASEGMFVRFEPGFGLNVHVGTRYRDAANPGSFIEEEFWAMSITGWERLCELVDEWRARPEQSGSIRGEGR